MLKPENFEIFVKDYFQDHSIEELEAALRIDENKKKKAILLHHIINENIENIIKEFYEFNLNNEKSRKYFKNKHEIDHLMDVNRKYFPYIFSGPFDHDYYKEKLKIGYIH